jgi:hypothetical protein
MNATTTDYTLDRILIDEHRAALIRSGRGGAGPLRRSTGAVLIRIGEWLRGKAEAAAESRSDAAASILKAA